MLLFDHVKFYFPEDATLLTSCNNIHCVLSRSIALSLSLSFLYVHQKNTRMVDDPLPFVCGNVLESNWESSQDY